MKFKNFWVENFRDLLKTFEIFEIYVFDLGVKTFEVFVNNPGFKNFRDFLDQVFKTSDIFTSQQVWNIKFSNFGSLSTTF